MTCSWIARHRAIAVVVLVGSSFAVSACTNGTSSVGPTNKGVAVPAINSQGYTFYTVDYALGQENEIAGINDNREVVGNYTSAANLIATGGACGNKTTENLPGTCSDCPLPSGEGQPSGISWQSYTSTYSGSSPYSSQTLLDYPDAKWQYMYAISNPSAQFNNQPIETGCLVQPGGEHGGELGGTWAVVDYGGLWSILKKYAFSNQCPVGAIGELLGIDISTSPVTAIGYFNYNKDHCYLQPWEAAPGDNKKQLTLSGTKVGNWTDIEAAGISNTNTSSPTVVGAATTTLTYAQQVGWSMPLSGGTAQPESYPGSKFTAFTGVSVIHLGGQIIVGWYTDAASNTHGLVYNKNSSAPWTSIDEPSAYGRKLTIIRGINANGDICGWYADKSGTYHGFVGIKYGVPRKHRENHQVIGPS